MRTAAVGGRAEPSGAGETQDSAGTGLRAMCDATVVSNQDDDGAVCDEPSASTPRGSSRRTAPLRALIARADNRHYVK